MAELEKKLFATLERTGNSDIIAGLQLPRESFLKVLMSDPEQLNNLAFQIGALADRLPWGTINPVYKAFYQVKREAGQEALVRSTADGMRRGNNVQQETGIDAGRLEELTDAEMEFRGMEQLGGRMKDSGMDLRTLVGAWQWFLIDQVLRYLEKRFADPKLIPRDRERLLDSFSGGLILIDDMFRWAAQRKQELAQQRDMLGTQVADAQDEAAMVDTILQIKQGINPAQDALLQAAKRHKAKQDPTGTASTASPPKHHKVPPVSKPRKLI